MASIAPRRPERSTAVVPASDFHISEFAADMAGSLSPFGPELEFPLPVEKLTYTHPTRANRPNLAEGR